MADQLKSTSMATFWAIAPEHATEVFGSLRRERDARGSAGVHAEAAPDDSALAVSKMITRVERGVAVISVSAALDCSTWLGWFSGEILALGHDAIRQAVLSALADPEVSAILLSIDSPGGVVQGTKELADFLAEAAASKPMAAYANGLCASAAFWIAAATGRILAPTTALVGSIGVIMCLEDYSGLYEKMGLRLEYIASGKFKAAGRSGKELTEEERAYFQDRLDRLHEIFKSDVRAHLGLASAEKDWAEAQLILADQAQPLGLVSGIVRDEQEALTLLAEETGMSKITKELLAREAPELLAEIQAGARAEGKAEASGADAAAAEESGVAYAMTAMRMVCKAEDVTACENLIGKARELSLSQEQLAGMATLLPSAAPTAPQNASGKDILSALIAAHEAPVNGITPPKTEKSPLLADAERRVRS